MMQLSIGTKGELVIPKKIRESLGLTKDRKVILEMEGKTIKLRVANEDIVKACEERAKKYNIDPKKLIYGDQLYEEVFS